MKRLLSFSSTLGRAVRMIASGTNTLHERNQTGQADSAGGTMHKSYLWEYRIDVPPYDKLMEVLEAFFCSYQRGDYSCENRERFKMQFRRGGWKKSLMGLGQLVPESLAKGRFDRWPVLVSVLVRPSPETYAITLRYQLFLPKSIPSLVTEVQSSVDQHIRCELQDLSAYLAECIGLGQPPAVSST